MFEKLLDFKGKGSGFISSGSTNLCQQKLHTGVDSVDPNDVSA